MEGIDNKLRVRSNMHGVVRHLRHYNKGIKQRKPDKVLSGIELIQYQQREQAYFNKLIRQVMGL